MLIKKRHIIPQQEAIEVYTLLQSMLPAKSPVAADAPKKYPEGNDTPDTSKHFFHWPVSSISVKTCQQ